MRFNFKHLQLHAPSVRTRLSMIQVLLCVTAVAVATVTWRTMEGEYRAAEQLLVLSRAQRLHQEVDVRHEALRADLNALLFDSGATVENRRELEARAAEERRLLDASLAELRSLRVPPDVADRVGLMRVLAEDYATQASKLIALAGSDRELALALEPNFRDDHEELSELNRQVTAFLSQRLEAEGQAAFKGAAARRWIVGGSIAVGVIVLVLVGLIKESIQRTLGSLRDTARALASGNLTVRSAIVSRDEVGDLAAALNQTADALQSMIDRLQADAERDAFNTQLIQAFEMADSERDVHQVVSRVMERIAPNAPMELLLSDSSRAHLERAAAHPRGVPGCSVESPFTCVAVRRGHPVVFDDSRALNTCPRLRDRSGESAAAVCVPVSFMGRSIGVLHATTPVDQALNPEQIAELTSLGMQAGAKIGTVRVFERTQLQARTDGLTGLSNRRTIEQVVRELAAKRVPYALALADLDHFKRLNDTRGHAAGDQALRLFGDVVRRTLRSGDHVARWGGEEFVIVMPNAAATEGVEIIERCRAELERTLANCAVPRFTASYGVADSTMAGELEHVIRIADQALYQAKETGRDRLAIGQPGSEPLLPEPRHASECDGTIDVRMLSGDS